MSEVEARARELCRRTHGNDSLWEMYLDDAARENRSGRSYGPQAAAPSDWVMPFGRYKGGLLKDIPRGYLIWLHDKAEIDDGLRTAVAEVLDL